MFVKSSTLYSGLLNMSGVFTLGPGFASSSVYPSGTAFATVSAPTEPPAPGRLSMTTCCPKLSPSFWPTRRALMSLDAPGVNGTTHRTGLIGSVAAGSPCAACAPPVDVSAANAPAAMRINGDCMGTLLVVFFSSLLALLQRLGIDHVDGFAGREREDLPESRAELRLVTVALDVADV